MADDLHTPGERIRRAWSWITYLHQLAFDTPGQRKLTLLRRATKLARFIARQQGQEWAR